MGFFFFKSCIFCPNPIYENVNKAVYYWTASAKKLFKIQSQYNLTLSAQREMQHKGHKVNYCCPPYLNSLNRRLNMNR